MKFFKWIANRIAIGLILGSIGFLMIRAIPSDYQDMAKLLFGFFAGFGLGSIENYVFKPSKEDAEEHHSEQYS